MNIADSIRVTRPSASLSTSGPVGESSLTNGNSGIFASLINGLVTIDSLVTNSESLLIAGLIPEVPSGLAGWTGTHASSKPKGKDTKDSEAGTPAAKNNELKPKAGLVQPTEVAPAFVNLLPILLGAFGWKTESQVSETAKTEPQTTSVLPAQPDTADILTKPTSLQSAASLPTENEPVPIAFSLRLTPFNQEALAIGSSASTSQVDRELSSNTNTALSTEALRRPPQVPPVGVADSNPDHSTTDRSTPTTDKVSGRQLDIPSQPAEPSPGAKVSDPIMFPGFGDGRARNTSRPEEIGSGEGERSARPQ